MRGREHRVQQRLRGVRQYQTGEAVDDHQPHAGEEQPQTRSYQSFDLRPQLLQAGLVLGQIGLSRARATAPRRTFRVPAHTHSTAWSMQAAHALLLPASRALMKERTQRNT